MDAANQIKALGDLEYRADLEPYLDPVSRYGFDPDVFQMGSQQKGFGPQAYSHYDRMNDTVNISESGLPSKSTQSHEYRHRGFAKLFKQYRKNPEFYEKKYPGIGGLLRELMGGRSGFNETITEFYDTDETYNLPAQYETTTPYSRGRTLGEDAGVVLARGRDYTDDPYVIERKDGLGMQVKKKTKQISGPARLDAGSPEELARRQNFIDYREQAPEDRDTENNMLFNKVLLLEQMAEDEYKNPQNFAQGGPVMRGIGTLNETARNMFRGPRGVGAYQQFASGGEAMGPPPTRGPDPQGIGYFQQFADGGPVYMKEGGEVITPDDIAGMREKIMNDYGFDPEDVAVQEGVPPELFLRLLFKENRGRQGPKSPKGAVGLAQLMPATAKELGVDPTVPYENAVGGARYLKQKIAEFDGDVLLGLAAYNAGAGNVRKYEGVPPFAETQDYVAVILGEGYSGGTSLSETIRKEQGFAPSMSYEGQENDVREEQGLVPISMASSGTSEGVGSLMRQESSAPETSLRPVLRPTAPSTSLRPVLRPEETSAPETSLRPVLRGQDQTLREKYAPENFERNLLSPDAFQYLNGLGVMEREGKKQGIETLDPRGIRRINNFAMERSTMA